jgi:hypothetical protein
LLPQPQGFLTPGMQLRVRQARPPHCIDKPQDPLRVLVGQRYEAVAPLFFRAYAGSGLVIQTLARFQPTPRRLMALRIASSENTREVSPRWGQTTAKVAKVPGERGSPPARGLSCRSARSCSKALGASSRFASRLAREERGSSTAKPSSLNRVTTVRTVCVEYPTVAAISVAFWPRALPNKIWHRFTVNPVEDRRPAAKTDRSSSVNARTNNGRILWRMPYLALLKQPVLSLH